MTINNKSERNYRGKCLGWPVTSYSGESLILRLALNLLFQSVIKNCDLRVN